MKRILFFTASVIFSILSMAHTYGLVAPVEPIPPVRPKFIPDWVLTTPTASNQTFRYVVESGEGATEREAENMALARVYQNVANATGQPISSAEINQALQTGSTFEVIEKKMRIPMIKLCTFPFRQNNDTYKVFVLYQVASAGNVTPMFDSYNDCMAHTFYDKQLAHYKKLEDEYKLKLDNYYKELDKYNKEIERRKLQEQARLDSIRQAELKAREQARLDSIANEMYNVQRINGPSCCTATKHVSWNGNSLTLYQDGATITFVCEFSGTLSFYYATDYPNRSSLIIKKNGKIIFNEDYDGNRVINNVQKGDKIKFINKNDYGYSGWDVDIKNIKITRHNK